MKYDNIVKAKFIDRPNRFIANIELDGKIIKAHVKNTGCCKELLISGCDIWVQLHKNENRKTPCSLITVSKNGQLFNIDSQIPNKVYEEYISARNIPYKREVTCNTSRFDFKEGYGYTEVKGVTLDINGLALFPDAPTLRGVKHITELTELEISGVHCKIIFILAYKGAKSFTANKEKDPEFAAALKKAFESGVEIRAYECEVTHDSIEICGEIPVYY